MIALLIVMFRFSRSIIQSLADPEFRAIAALFFGMLVIGTIFYSAVEGWSLFNSLYFSVMTLATVGYGDFTPKTVLGKAFTIVYVLVGISILLAFVNTISKHSLQDPHMLGGRRRLRRDDTSEPDSQNDVESTTEPEQPD